MKTPKKRDILYKLWNISKNDATIVKCMHSFGERSFMYHYQKDDLKYVE